MLMISNNNRIDPDESFPIDSNSEDGRPPIEPGEGSQPSALANQNKSISSDEQKTSKFKSLVELYKSILDNESPDRPIDIAAFLADHLDYPARQRMDVLLYDQVRGWESGGARKVEDYLAEFPEIQRDRTFIVDLIYNEYLRRQDRGESPDIAEFYARFPDFRQDLEPQFLIARMIGADSSEIQASDAQADAVSDVRPGVEDEAAKENRADPPIDPVPQGAKAEVDRFLNNTPAPLSLGDFQLLKRVSEGGMGVIYRARQISLDRIVAVKFLKSVGRRSDKSVDRFWLEGRAVARLKHEHIVSVYGIGHDESRGYFLVMDWIDGPDLSQRIKNQSLVPSRSAELVEQVARAVAHAHGNGIIHRDLKPSNVLINHEGRAVVVDFGLTKILDAGGSEPFGPEQMMGTPAYMAPEQADHRWGPIGPRTDVYGLGALLYALLTGKPPFIGNDDLDTRKLVASTDPPVSPGKIRPLIPKQLELICMKCLEKDPARRYESALEVAIDLKKNRSVPISTIFLTIVIILIALSGVIGFGLRFRPGDVAVSSRNLADSIKYDDEIDVDKTKSDDAAPNSHALDSIKVSRGRGDNQLVELTKYPGPLVKDDRVSVSCRFSRPSHAYLFWIDSDGKVARLHPNLKSKGSAKVKEFRWPSNPARGGVISSPSTGTETAVLVIRDNPLDEASAKLLQETLRPIRPIPPLDRRLVVNDGVLVKIDEIPRGFEAKYQPDEIPRGFEAKYQPLVAKDVVSALEAIQQNASRFGEVHIVALPYLIPSLR
jgi:serine/threonine protein kinase